MKFHPIMANFAMNLYIGMNYEDIRDVCPFVFPTVRSLQRERVKVSTHEGTNPTVYARVFEMDGFKNRSRKRDRLDFR